MIETMMRMFFGSPRGKWGQRCPAKLRPPEPLERRTLLSAQVAHGVHAATSGPRNDGIDIAASRPSRAPEVGRGHRAQGDVVIDWNKTLLQAVRNDATNPPLAARNMAMVQLAIYDAIDMIHPRYTLYPVPGLNPRPPRNASPEAAAASAADRVLSRLYPNQAAVFDAELRASLARIPGGRGKSRGVTLGQSVGDAILKWRSTDGSTAVAPYTPGTGPGRYQLTPPKFRPALQWVNVAPFAMTSGSQFRPPGPPPLTSAQYAADFNEVKSVGGVDSTTRTLDQTLIAHFWADVPGRSVTPPGHWNEIAEQVSLERHLSVIQNARLFALLDIALADAGIDAWDAKYFYDSWRPITAIQQADTDGNPLTVADPTWTPLWETPNFSEYTSGHSTFSGAADAVLTSFFGPNVGFTIGSDDMPGYTRSFASFSQAADEAGKSRIYGGIHFQTANQDGLASGRALGHYVFQNFLVSQRNHSEGGRRVAATSG